MKSGIKAGFKLENRNNRTAYFWMAFAHNSGHRMLCLNSPSCLIRVQISDRKKLKIKNHFSRPKEETRILEQPFCAQIYLSAFPQKTSVDFSINNRTIIIFEKFLFWSKKLPYLNFFQSKQPQCGFLSLVKIRISSIHDKIVLEKIIRLTGSFIVYLVQSNIGNIRTHLRLL